MADQSQVMSDILDNIRRVFQILNEHSEKVERETGLTSPQLWTMKVIAEEAPIRVDDIARRIYLHPATVINILEKLETRGLVVIKRSWWNRHVVFVELTNTGNKMIESAPEVAQGLLISGLEKLPYGGLIEINYRLNKLVEILGATEIPPKLIRSQEVNLREEIQRRRESWNQRDWLTESTL
jgi:DNA-binding MarR family transcriptional regulator